MDNTTQSTEERLQELLAELYAAVKVEDIPRADVAIEVIREHAKTHDIKLYGRDDTTLIANAFLEVERLKERGPVVEDPNAHVVGVVAALDAKNPDRARELMGELQGSWASMGPKPDDEHTGMLTMAMIRRDW